MQDYHQLDIWNRAMDYAVAVYTFASSLPGEEKYNLASLESLIDEGNQISRMTYKLMQDARSRQQVAVSVQLKTLELKTQNASFGMFMHSMTTVLSVSQSWALTSRFPATG
jgi:hypothetical protein